MKINCIINRDAREALPYLPENTFDCCVTSPPYYGLRDYQEEGQIGREESVEEYLQQLVTVFREVRRVLTKSGSLWVVMGDTYAGTKPKKKSLDQKYPKGRTGQANCVNHKVPGYKPKDLMGIPWQLALALRKDGWYLRSDIIWHKENAMPESCQDRPTRSYEHIFLFTKSPKYYYNQPAMQEPMKPSSIERYRRRRSPNNKYQQKNTGVKMQSLYQAREGMTREEMPYPMRNGRDIWTINTGGFRGEHYAVFPEKLVHKCLLAGCPPGGMVLDPFMGSGTVGKVAIETRRNYVGIELSKKYCALAKARIEQKEEEKD